MLNTDRFIFIYVRRRHKLGVSQAAAKLGVSDATWRSWECGKTQMHLRFWVTFNRAFDTHLNPDNVRPHDPSHDNGPAGIQDIEGYTAIMARDAAEARLKTFTTCPVSQTLAGRRAKQSCKDLRATRALTPYEAAELVGVSLAKWQSWELGRTAPSRHYLNRIKQNINKTLERQPNVQSV